MGSGADFCVNDYPLHKETSLRAVLIYVHRYTNLEGSLKFLNYFLKHFKSIYAGHDEVKSTLNYIRPCPLLHPQSIYVFTCFR